MTTTVNIRFKFRRDTAAAWTAANPVLLAGEPGLETDTGKLKFGDGTTAWNSLAYFGAGYSQSEIEEFARDALGAALTAGAGITVTPNDGLNTITIASSITQYTDEMARDALGAALTQGTGITITPNDGADTITIAVDTAVIDERARDALGAALVAGTGITLTVNDGADTITISSSSGSAYAYPDVTGEYHLNVTNAANLSTVAIAANSLTLYPLIPLANDMTIAALAAYVTTGVSGNLRIGIYADNGGKPDGGALIVSTGALSTTTTNSAIEGAVSTTLARGTRYWLALLSDATATFRAIALGSTMPLPVSTDLSSTGVRNRRTSALTYGTLPSTCPSTSKSGSAHIAVGLKIA